MATLGFNTLPGSTRVRAPSRLVRLDQLPGSGPQGPAGPTGPQGPAVDTSLFYTKSQVDGALMLKENLMQTATHPGAKIFDSTLRQFRNVLGAAGVEKFIFHNPATKLF